MRNKPLLAIILLCAVAAFASAQALTVGYLDGTVELKTAKGWKALSIGDSVPPDASIRISQSGSLELSKGTRTITIVKDGTYAVAALTRSADKPASGGLAPAMTQKLKSLTAEKGQGQTTVGGVRGAAQGEPEALQWVDESDDSLKKASELLKNGQYGEAVPVLTSAIAEAASDGEKRELTYMLVSAYYGSGQTARAYRAVAKLPLDSSDPNYPDLVILKAQILVKTQAYADGLSLLKPFIQGKPPVPYAQTAYLLSALCSRGAGDEGAAQDALKAGLALDPKSETAREIQAAVK